jgi:putative salt-induced outer membrane protein
LPIKISCIVMLLCTSFGAAAKLDMMKGLYLADGPYADQDVQKDFVMSGELGLLFNSGNTQASSLIASIRAEQELEDWSNNYIANIFYKQNRQQDGKVKSTQTTAQRVFVSAQMDYKLTQPNSRLFMYGEYENDKLGEFRYQAAFAAGWTSSLWADKTSEFKYSIGPGYAISEQQLSLDNENDTESGIIVRAAVEYKRKFSSTATFTQFLSTEADQQAAKSKSETALTAKINGDLAMKLSLTLDHNNAVEDTSSSLDTRTSVSLIYHFF